MVTEERQAFSSMVRSISEAVFSRPSEWIYSRAIHLAESSQPIVEEASKNDFLSFRKSKLGRESSPS